MSQLKLFFFNHFHPTDTNTNRNEDCRIDLLEFLDFAGPPADVLEGWKILQGKTQFNA